ncbi:DMT family transporter [Pseudovibrio exalbescens]|uniref:DMT family transporter n=1 Tax=Pseudovibrio exalbescens TaxID=197461 RepID=UPI0023664D69|nr:DMT family transporter [Pseudovibrio exalbescens]MDD7909691.1 DMT family transporter [Pseudovibrio exalbescens]
MENIRGSAWMVLAMLGFAVEDMFVKLAADGVPVGQILMLFGLGGMVGFLLLTWRRGERALVPQAMNKTLAMRAVFEISGRLFFILSLALSTLSSTSAILQATPLAVTLGAAVFMGERVGWQRWIAILIGFIGVLLVIKPTPEAFQLTSILAVLGMLGFAGRDLATRAAPPALSNMQLGVYGFAVLVPTGGVYAAATSGFVWPDAFSWFAISGATVIGIGAYYALTVAMRTGEVSVVTPFRYSRLLFALGFGFAIFGETPDLMMLLGSSIIVLSGIYILVNGRRALVPSKPAAL